MKKLYFAIGIIGIMLLSMIAAVSAQDYTNLDGTLCEPRCSAGLCTYYYEYVPVIDDFELCDVGKSYVRQDNCYWGKETGVANYKINGVPKTFIVYENDASQYTLESGNTYFSVESQERIKVRNSHGFTNIHEFDFLAQQNTNDIVTYGMEGEGNIYITNNPVNSQVTMEISRDDKVKTQVFAKNVNAEQLHHYLVRINAREFKATLYIDGDYIGQVDYSSLKSTDERFSLEGARNEGEIFANKYGFGKSHFIIEMRNGGEVLLDEIGAVQKMRSYRDLGRPTVLPWDYIRYGRDATVTYESVCGNKIQSEGIYTVKKYRTNEEITSVDIPEVLEIEPGVVGVNEDSRLDRTLTSIGQWFRQLFGGA